MHHPVTIESGTPIGAFGVVVPNLISCFSIADMLDEVTENVKEAIELWLEVAINEDMAAPDSTPLAGYQCKHQSER